LSNNLVEMWRRGETACGIWCYLNNELAMEMSGSPGPDYVLVDLQHGVAGISEAIHMVRASQFHGTNPIVRVPHCEPELIGKMLDGGAAGIMVPMVESGETAAKMVEACRYPPQGGIRSFGPVRAALLQGTTSLDVLSDVAAIAMIETVKGVEAAEEIANTPGLSAIYIGPVDLSISLGLGPAMPSDNPLFLDAVAKVKKACDAAGIVIGMHCQNGEVAGAFARDGFRMLTVATDIDLVKVGAKRELEAARASFKGVKA
jgi:4-hydroxy-2-oxoheptanedioate aldolase